MSDEKKLTLLKFPKAEPVFETPHEDILDQVYQDRHNIREMAVLVNTHDGKILVYHSLGEGTELGSFIDACRLRATQDLLDRMRTPSNPFPPQKPA